MRDVIEISEDFYASETIGKLSIGARLLFINICFSADKENSIPASLDFMRNRAFIYDDLSSSEVKKFLEEILEQNLIVYLGEKNSYQINDFRFHRYVE